jgi:hypothetical protein
MSSQVKQKAKPTAILDSSTSRAPVPDQQRIFDYEGLYFSQCITFIRISIWMRRKIRPQVSHGQDQFYLVQGCYSHQRSESCRKITCTLYNHHFTLITFFQKDLANFDLLYLSIKQDGEHHKKAKNTNEVDRKLEALLKRYDLEETIHAFKMVLFLQIFSSLPQNLEVQEQRKKVGVRASAHKQKARRQVFR